MSMYPLCPVCGNPGSASASLCSAATPSIYHPSERVMIDPFRQPREIKMMTDYDTIWARHFEQRWADGPDGLEAGDGECACGEDWPCDAAILYAEIERLRDVAIQAEMDIRQLVSNGWSSLAEKRAIASADAIRATLNALYEREGNTEPVCPVCGGTWPHWIMGAGDVPDHRYEGKE